MKRENAARSVARAMGWAGARGGWIFDADRRPLAAGWHALADRLEVRGWIVDKGPGRGWEVAWRIVPAPGTVRPSADVPLEPMPGGPPHPDGSQPAARRPMIVRSPPRDRWALAPEVCVTGNHEHAAALATIAAVQAAEAQLSFPRESFDNPEAARKRAREITAATGQLWRAVKIHHREPPTASASQPVDR